MILLRWADEANGSRHTGTYEDVLQNQAGAMQTHERQAGFRGFLCSRVLPSNAEYGLLNFLPATGPTPPRPLSTEAELVFLPMPCQVARQRQQLEYSFAELSRNPHGMSEGPAACGARMHLS